MTDDEILEECMDVRASSNGIALRVRCTIWPLPHEPKSHWRTVFILPVGTSIEALKMEMHKLLRNKKYFAVCEECHERNPTEWMHTGKICQSCAEQNHGVVY